jgi:hypothetical protein
MIDITISWENEDGSVETETHSVDEGLADYIESLELSTRAYKEGLRLVHEEYQKSLVVTQGYKILCRDTYASN